MHKQAAKNTLLLLVSALMGGLGVAAIVAFVPFQSFLVIGGIGFVCYMIWIFYSMEKTRLETLDQLNKQ